MKICKMSSSSLEIALKDGSRFLVSYETPVAMYCSSEKVYLTTKKFWSSTTSKHINKWINRHNCQEVEQEVLDNKFNSI